MNRKQLTERIIDILMQHEDDLSDGYRHYATDWVEHVAKHIAAMVSELMAKKLSDWSDLRDTRITNEKNNPATLSNVQKSEHTLNRRD